MSSSSTRRDLLLPGIILNAAAALAWPQPAEASCVDSCGGQSPQGCFCDDMCPQFGDCCGDFGAVCEEPFHGEATLQIGHSFISEHDKGAVHLHTMPDEEITDSHVVFDEDDPGTGLIYRLTAMASATGEWFYARYNGAMFRTELFRSDCPDSPGQLVIALPFYSIDALAVHRGDDGSETLVVAMNVADFTTGRANGTGSTVLGLSLADESWSTLGEFDAANEITGIAAGDFDGDGDDDMAWATNSTHPFGSSRLLTTDGAELVDASVEVEVPYLLRFGAMTAGTFDGGQLADDVVVVMRWSSFENLIMRINFFSGDSSTILDWTSGATVSGLAAGDLVGDDELAGDLGEHDELVVAIVDKSFGPTVILSGDASTIETSGGTTDFPTSFLAGLPSPGNALMSVTAFRPGPQTATNCDL